MPKKARGEVTVGTVISVALLVLVALGLVLALTRCQFWAKALGGTINVHLPADKKLVNASWKDSNLWILVRDAEPGDEPKAYEYKEYSNMGVLQGVVVIQETAAKKAK
jgi:hypothetical protein